MFVSQNCSSLFWNQLSIVMLQTSKQIDRSCTDFCHCGNFFPFFDHFEGNMASLLISVLLCQRTWYHCMHKGYISLENHSKIFERQIIFFVFISSLAGPVTSPLTKQDWNLQSSQFFFSKLSKKGKRCQN